ncbi:MAG: twin-arginine translocase TatA/TatE family subunit [Chlorobia bacterium]|nr:twin-arginine translocase TatA/TatE family subunit [Fimbriimonadaceae bacterium]
MNYLYDLTPLVGNLLQPWHIIILVGVIILFFGGSKIPELMKGMGQGMGEFKKGLKESKTEEELEEDSKTKSLTP